MEKPDYTALEGLLATYKKNRQQVPKDLLETKYKTGWDALKEKIRQEASDTARRCALHGLTFYRDDFHEEGGIADQINAAWAAGGYAGKVGRALFKNTDLDEFRIIAEGFRKEVEAMHAAYLQKRTSEGKSND